MDKLPEATAKECDQRFPVIERVETVTITDSALLKQYEVEFNYMAVLIDSLLSANCDTVYIDKIKEVIRRIPCKPETKIITRTLESTAKVEVIRNQYNQSINELNACKEQINARDGKIGKLKTRNNWMWVIIVFLTIFAFRKQIAKLVL